MKKIILGCAAVLLSIGLLAGCNNKEDEPPITEAVSLSVSQTSVNLEPGGSASVTYTVSPEKATVMALSDHEEYVTAVAQEGTIYLEAVAAGTAIVSVGAEYEDYASAEAQITVTVAEVVEPGLPEIELVVDPISEPLIVDGDPVEVTYSVDPEDAEIEMEVANEEYATVAYLEPDEENPDDPAEEAGWYLTPVAEGETTLTVTASLDEYETASVEVDIVVHESGWVEPFASYTVKVTLTTSTDAAFPDPGSDYALWVASDYDSASNNTTWGEAHAMTYEENGVFTYKYEGAPTWTSATYSGGVYAGTTESENWSLQFGEITITNPTSESGDVVGEFSIKSTIGDTWEGVLPLGNGTTNFHIVVFEDSSNETSTLSTFTTISGSPDYFDSSDGGGNSATTLTSGTTSYSSQPYVYNATAASAGPMDRVPSWVTMHESANVWTTEVGLAWAMDYIPDTTEGTIAVFCFVLNTSSLTGTWVEGVAASGITGLNNGWVTGVSSIEEFFSTYVTGTVAIAAE